MGGASAADRIRALNLTNTVMSKRHLKSLVDDGVVEGWDDPRMPTIAGLRRRGYTPESIRGLLREDRRVQSQQHGGCGAAGALCKRRSEGKGGEPQCGGKIPSRS